MLKSSKAFTLIELLIVVGILSVIAAITVLVINPTQILAQARDSRRFSDLASIKSALQLYQTQGSLPGNSTVVYISLPDTSSICANLSLPALPAGWLYNCVTSSNLRNSNGTGWIPVNFASLSSSPLPVLPIDPVNSPSNGFYYTYVPSWSLTGVIESSSYQNKYGAQDGGYAPSAFELNSTGQLTPLASVERGGDLWISKISANGPIVKMKYDGTVMGSYPGIGNGGSTGIAIDDAGYVWVSDYLNGTVVKVNRSDGGITGTYAVGASPYGVAVDASGNIWVAGGTASSYVAKVNGTSGIIMGTYGAGTLNAPKGVVVDTSGNIWVTNLNNSTVTKFNSSTGAIIGTYCSAVNCGFPYGIAADSSGNILIANSSGSITKLNASTGAFIAKYAIAGSPNVEGIAADSLGNVWATDATSTNTYKIRISDGLISGPYSTGQPSCQYGFGGTAIDFSGNVWITSYCGYMVEINATTGTVIGTYSTSGSAPNSYGDSTGFAYQYFVLGRR